MLRMPVLVISRQPWIALSFTINCFEEIQTVSFVVGSEQLGEI